MLTCSGCIRTYLRTTFSDVLYPTYSGYVAVSPRRSTRFASTVPKKEPWLQRGSLRDSTRVKYDQRRKEPPVKLHAVQGGDRRNRLISSSANGRPGGRSRGLKKSNLKKELLYLQDPLQLADKTLHLLNQGDYQKALEMVRVAGNNFKCTVSWNHLINDNMNHGNIAWAIKLYNDMKKRAQVPDAYTYTILLRGLAKHANYPKSLERALSIYHSMFNENSPCKPSTIHTNAVLNVCAHAKDLDALFGIAAKIPSRGMGAADNYTYTTILNAIRSVAWANTVELKDEGQGVKDAQRSEAVSKGRRIWIDIVDRWKRGHISMDEQLVCAMGRVLLLSNSIDDTDDILSLLEQTMRLPREVPRLGDPARGTHLRPVTSSDPTSAQAAGDGAEPQPLFENDENEQPINTESDLALVEEDSTSLTTVFNALPPVSNRIYAVPGRNALSLAIEACAQMKEFAAAQDYWGKLTRTVKPDAENYHVYLRLLRARRGGALAVDLLCAMLAPKREGGLGTGVVPKTFRLAMSTVVRDSLNRNSLQLATQIMTMMQGLLEEPDVRTGMMMLSLMNKDGHRFDPDYVKLALESLYALSRHLMSVSDYASSRNKSKSPPQDLDDTMEDEDIPETSTRQFLVKDSPKHTETTEMQEPEDAQHIDTTETTESEDKPPIAPPQRKLTERQLEILEFISAVVREHERSMYALYADSFTGRPNKRYKQQYMQLNAWILANDPRKSHAWERSRKDTRRAIGMKHLKWLDRKAVNSVAPLEAYEKSELRKAYE